MKRHALLILLILLTAFVTGCIELPTTTVSTTTAFPTTLSTTTATTTSATTTVTTTTSASTVSTTTGERYQTIELFSLNDVHGGAYYDDLSTFAKIAGLLEYKQSAEDDVIILASGDMFQGTALSNYYYGRPLVDVMNYVGFDAFTLGNHEFDWGIERIGAYADGLPENGEAAFPFLAANIVSTETGEPLSWTEPYLVVDVDGVRVGIVGVIGEVISSISASRVEGYEFLDPAETIGTYATLLRTEEDCDVVVASIHEYASTTNNAVAALTGTARVDAVFNGHSHTSVASAIVRNGTDLAYAQVSSYDQSAIAKITLVFDRATDAVTQAVAEVLSVSGLTADAEALAILAAYESDPAYVAFVSQVLAEAQSSYGRDALAPWGASVVRDYAGVDFGMVNAGGFRTTMAAGPVTMGDLVTIYPFDNLVKTCRMTGAQLTAFYEDVMENGWDVVWDDAVSYAFGSGELLKDGLPVDLDAVYRVGAVDYIFDKTHYAFRDGTDIVTTDLAMRSLLALDLANHAGGFDPAGGTAYPLSAVFLAPRRRDGMLYA